MSDRNESEGIEPRNYKVKEADGVPKLEGNMCGIYLVRYYRSFGV
jgi:hypothetical protein